ncbi:MAG: glycosyltransferase family 2 protein [Lachnospiraceae bacterium]|nr:glycosyltransferase family 2 protein [Lachnospiraceae bacterium]
MVNEYILYIKNMTGVIVTETIDIVVPCFNEEEVLKIFYVETKKILDTINNYTFHFIFVDDGSKDKTLAIMNELSNSYPNVSYLSFSRNFGKEAAMYAGLKYSSGDYVIVMDADLQHPPALIPEMVKDMNSGYDCVAAMRTTRTNEDRLRSLFSRMFYRLSNMLTDVELVQGAVDFRIMTRQMVNAVLDLSEVQRFSKGIFSWVGFRTKWIPYENVERTIGKTKWSFWNLFKYALDGITAFSIVPLRMVSILGFIISVFAGVYIIITIAKAMITGIDVPGYVTTLSAILFLGGIIELSVGILGEYIGHIYMESKNRPIFILKQTNLNLTDKTPRNN